MRHKGDCQYLRP